MKDIFDFIFVRLYYFLFVRPRTADKVFPEWNIDLSSMKATYRGQDQGHDPLAGITMTFYLAGDGEGGKTLCGGLDSIPAATQTALDAMPPKHSSRLLCRLIEEGDRVFRTVWEQSTK